GTFSVMVADLDHFKSVNDTYGHNAGDMALKHVAEQLRKTIGPGDIVSRFGGEEFLIILPGADDQAARQAADRLRVMVRDTEIYVPGNAEPIQVTISIGVTVAQSTGNGAKPSIETLLGEADQALYRSKSDGRDTVRFNRSSAA
ncbi:MAG: GGDEF domain-containing protein, partial [Pseudomonadota bacterium]